MITEEQKNRVANVLSDIREFKAQIEDGLKDVKVIATTKDDPEVMAAIQGLWGDKYIEDGIAYITPKMFFECMNVMNKAGKYKAEELLK